MDKAFHDEMATGYALTEPGLVIGSPMLDGELANDARVQVALSMMNRHGLIAGATGTGKTKTLQLLAGQLSKAGVPVFVADIKGDLTGIAAPGDATNPKVVERVTSLGWTFEPAGPPGRVPVAVGQARRPGPGDRPLVRSAAARQGPRPQRHADLDPVARSSSTATTTTCRCSTSRTSRRRSSTSPRTRASRSSPTTAGCRARRSACSCARSSCSSRKAPTSSSASPSSTSPTCCERRPRARGSSASSSCPTSWTSPGSSRRSCSGCSPSSTRRCPRSGDLPKPKLCFFFDEAHLLFDDASEALLDQIERTARLIRSKGVGVYFVTQAPTDVPSSVLAQLGNRVQHALRAFTPDDADALRKTARTFPTTTFYDVEKTITSLGTGEALVTVLSPRGVPTPLAATRLLAPDSLDGAARSRSSSPAGSRPARSPRSTARRSTATAPTSGSTPGSPPHARPRRRRPPMPPSGPAWTRRPRPGSTR